MRRLIPCVLLCLAGVAPAETLDQVVATVDTEVILYSDLVAEVEPLLQDLRLRAASAEEFQRQSDQIMREALDQAIERKILYREAVLSGFTITDKEVEDRMQKVLEGYESPEAFRRMLENAGETMSDFREGLRKQILAISLGMQRRREFEEQAVVSEAEARQYFTDHKSEFEMPERVKVRRIFLAAGEDPAERARVSARLEALAEDVRLGGDFAALAREHSEGPDAEGGGLVGWVARGDLVPELEGVVFSLSPGELSGVVETQWGFHLLRVDERQDAGLASFEEARPGIERALRAQFADERYQKWINELRQRRRVRVLI